VYESGVFLFSYSLPDVSAGRISRELWCTSQKFSFFSYSLPDVSAGRVSRELWYTSQEFSLAGIIIITMALHAHMSPG
jgi:hypothetical protein